MLVHLHIIQFDGKVPGSWDANSMATESSLGWLYIHGQFADRAR